MSESKSLAPIKSAHNVNLHEVAPVVVTRDQMTRMLFETHKKCANAAEEVMTIRELSKINDLYPRGGEHVTVSHHVVHSLDKLQSMDDAQLARMMGEEALFDMPEPIAVDAQFTEIDTDDEQEADPDG